MLKEPAPFTESNPSESKKLLPDEVEGVRSFPLEAWLPVSLWQRLAALVSLCALGIFLCTFPFRKTPTPVSNNAPLLGAQQVESAWKKAQANLFPYYQELSRLRALTQAWEPPGQAPWFDLLQYSLERFPQTKGIRMAFLPQHVLGPKTCQSLYVYRNAKGECIQEDLSRETQGPFNPVFSALDTTFKDMAFVQGWWSAPFSSQYHEDKPLITFALPILRHKEGQLVLDGMVGFDVDLPVLQSFFAADPKAQAKKHPGLDQEKLPIPLAWLDAKHQPVAILDPALQAWGAAALSHQVSNHAKENHWQTAVPWQKDAMLFFLKPLNDLLWPGPPPALTQLSHPGYLLFALPAAPPSTQASSHLLGFVLPWIVGLAAMLWLMRWSLKRIMHNIALVRQGVRWVQAGELKKKLPASRTGDETASLVEAFNDMMGELDLEVGGLKEAVQKQQRSEVELGLAHAIQASVLPGPIRPVGGSIHGLTLGSREAGADFFDHFVLPGGRTAMLVGDVSGKGIQAAAFMMRASFLLRSAISSMAPENALVQVNAMLAKSNPQMMFVTLLLAIWDPKNKSLDYLNAGHQAALILRANGHKETLTANGTSVIGVLKGQHYQVEKVPFQEGDLLAFYTKGLCDAQNVTLSGFGDVRIWGILQETRGQPLAACAQKLVDEVLHWQAGPDRLDDMTLSLFRAERAPSYLKLPAAMATVETVAAMVEAAAQAGGMEAPPAREMAMAASEAVTNVITHALYEDPNLFYQVFASWSGDEFLVRIEDAGLPFDPAAITLEEMKDMAAHQPAQGLGWILIRQAVDHVQMDRVADTNILSLIRLKHRPTTWQ